MTLEALILGCGIMTYEQATYIRERWREYDNRAVACAVIRWKQEQPKPRLKSLEEGLRDRAAKQVEVSP